jgi:hypothetical protein
VLARGFPHSNSAIVHAGCDAEPGSLKARFNIAGNPLYDQLCRDLDVPFQRIGSLVLAFSEEERHALLERGARCIPHCDFPARESRTPLRIPAPERPARLAHRQVAFSAGWCNDGSRQPGAACP